MSPWENTRVAAAQVAAARPDGVLVCGDVARLEGRVEDYQELTTLLAPVAAVAPVYVALGNHDDRARLPQRLRRDAGERTHRSTGGS